MADDASANIEILNGTAQTQLKTIIERIERLEEDKAGNALGLRHFLDHLPKPEIGPVTAGGGFGNVVPQFFNVGLEGVQGIDLWQRFVSHGIVGHQK